MLVVAVPRYPSSVEATTFRFQVVMLSASLKLRCARPRASVSTDGCQSSVSGKYSRKRGVDAAAAKATPGTMDARDATSVCNTGTAAVTSTVSDVYPTSIVTSTIVVWPVRTGTLVIT